MINRHAWTRCPPRLVPLPAKVRPARPAGDVERERRVGLDAHWQRHAQAARLPRPRGQALLRLSGAVHLTKEMVKKNFSAQ